MGRQIDVDLLKDRFYRRLNWLKKDVHDQYSLGLFHGCETDMGLIDEIPTATTWIPRDTPPQKNGKYLCRYTFEGTSPPIWFYQVLDYYATDEVPHFQHEGGEFHPVISHWQPFDLLEDKR